MQKAILAIIPALLLLSSAAMVMPAQAQLSNIGVVEHRIYITCSDNQQGTPATTTLQLPGADISGFICTENNPIKSVDFQTWALFYTNEYTLEGSTFSSPTVKVLARDGSYKTVSGSGGPVFERVNEGSNTVWRIHQIQVPASAIESIIGTGIADFKGEIRYTAPAFSFDTNKGSFSIPSSTTVWKSLTHEGTDSGGNVGSPETPSGKLYYVITGERKDGSTFTYTSSTIRPFSVSIQGQGEELNSITYSLRMLIDNDIWNVNQIPQFDDQSLQGNWQAFVESSVVDKEDRGTIQKIVPGNTQSGAAVYEINRMKVLASDIEPHLPVVGEDIRSGNLKFTFNHAKIELRSPSGNYDIDVPAQSVTVKVGGYAEIVDDEPGECDIVNGETTCGTETLLSPEMMIGIGVAVAAMIGGIAVLAKKKK